MITNILSCLNTVWSLVSSLTYKWLIVGVAIVILIVFFQYNTIKSLKEDLIICNTKRVQEKALYDDEIKKAKTTIQSQNESITKFKLDIENYNLVVSEKERKLTELNLKQQSDIRKELSKDSSESNQLKIINKLLKDFSNEIN